MTEFIEQSFGKSIRPGISASTRPSFHLEAIEWGEVDLIEIVAEGPPDFTEVTVQEGKDGFECLGFIKSFPFERSDSFETYRGIFGLLPHATLRGIGE